MRPKVESSNQDVTNCTLVKDREEQSHPPSASTLEESTWIKPITGAWERRVKRISNWILRQPLAAWVEAAAAWSLQKGVRNSPSCRYTAHTMSKIVDSRTPWNTSRVRRVRIWSGSAPELIFGLKHWTPRSNCGAVRCETWATWMVKVACS